MDTVTGLVEPLGELTQLAGDSVSVSWSTKPEATLDQESVTLPGPAGAMLRYGAPGVWTATAET